MKSWDEEVLRTAIRAAQTARGKGNHPFGAVLADMEGAVLLVAENNVTTGSDCTGHAETNLVRMACAKYDREFLATCSLYTSTEPCPMCSGAIYMSNIRRVVYSVSEHALFTLTGLDNAENLLLSCRDVFAKGKKSIEVIGPMLEDEGLKVHQNFWEQI